MTRISPTWMLKDFPRHVCGRSLECRVKMHQEKYVSRHNDRLKRVKRVFAVGDWVRTYSMGVQKRGLSKWSLLKRITKVVGNSVWLSDGKKWNVRSVTLCSAAERSSWLERAGGSQMEKGGNDVGNYKRVKKTPKWHNDCDLLMSPVSFINHIFSSYFVILSHVCL